MRPGESGATLAGGASGTTEPADFGEPDGTTGPGASCGRHPGVGGGGSITAGGVGSAAGGVGSAAGGAGSAADTAGTAGKGGIALTIVGISGRGKRAASARSIAALDRRDAIAIRS